MAQPARTLVNIVSLARLPLALCLVAIFGPDRTRLTICMALCVIALATDMADGFLARRLGVASTIGRHWDSLGDKSFYIAVIVAFLEHGLLLAVLAWGLLTREVALYITRILYFDNIDAVERIRPYTNWHGYFMYAMIALGFAQIYVATDNRDLGVYPFVQLAAAAALAFGVLSIFAYIHLKD